jgi:RHS repeat-associated protein
VALVETQTEGTDSSPPQVLRYQFGNHLGSVSLELDQEGSVISYEEYYPYGSTSYQAGPSAFELSLKRYRYIGKERDEETGLYYHGARYAAPWLGRWISCDPAELRDGPNGYRYCLGNPILLRDPAGTQSEGDTPRVPEHILPPNHWQFHLSTDPQPAAVEPGPKVPESVLPRNRWQFHLGEPFEHAPKTEAPSVPESVLPKGRWEFQLGEPAEPFTPGPPSFRANTGMTDINTERVSPPLAAPKDPYKGILTSPAPGLPSTGGYGPPVVILGALDMFNEKIVKGSVIPNPSKANALEVETRAPSGFGPAAGLKIPLDKIPGLDQLKPPKLLSLDRFAISGPTLGSELNVPAYTQSQFPIILPSGGMGAQLNYYIPGHISNRKDTSREHAVSSDWPNSVSVGVGQAGTTLYYAPYTANFSFPGIKSNSDPNIPNGVMVKFGFTYQF